MRYGKVISTWPSSASSFSTISRTICWKVSTVISRSFASRISTKRDMCVPLKWCGRPTYMLKLATVCCTPPERSWMRIGWRMAFTPTLSMASLRESGVAWTSGMFCRSRAFISMILPYIPTNLVGHCLLDRGANALAIETDRRKQLAGVAVVDEAIRQAEHHHLLARARQRLANRAARPAHDLVLFHGHDQMMRVGDPFQEIDIQRLDEAHVDHRGVERVAGFERRLEHRAESEDGDALALPANLRLADRDGLQFLGKNTGSSTTGIAHRAGAVDADAGGEHLPAFLRVRGRHDDEVRHRAQVGVVERAVVGRAVAADQPAAIEREQHRQVLDGDVVDQLVVAALQESGVDRQHRPQAFAGESGGEGHRVLLGDADVEVALREALGVLDHARAFAHRRRDGDQARLAR